MRASSRAAQACAYLLAGAVAAPLLVCGASIEAADPRLVAYGREIAKADALGRELACARCHGALGVGRPGERAPRLAGQPRVYLRKQLEDFAAGLRPSEEMAPVARALTETQRYAVASYYAELKDVPYPPQPDGDPALLQRGGVLAAVGDEERGVRACELCHADAGVGIAPGFPYLAGQHAAYAERQLRLWREGERRNDPQGVMAEIARQLSDDEIRALALYFARVRPPARRLSSPIPAEPIPPPPEEPALPD